MTSFGPSQYFKRNVCKIDNGDGDDDEFKHCTQN